LNFIYVDKILKMTPGKSLCAIKRIREDEEIFQVHYPGYPVIPGSFLIEMMAQTAGRCLDSEKRPRGLSMLARVKSASFRMYVGPKQEAFINGEIVVNQDNVATAICNIKVNDNMVCNGELFFTFIPYDKLVKGFRDEVLESYFSEINKFKSGGKNGRSIIP
jgi:3-hydroxyacyl-[acyl-carrier-protein] dehydratase